MAWAHARTLKIVTIYICIAAPRLVTISVAAVNLPVEYGYGWYEESLHSVCLMCMASSDTERVDLDMWMCYLLRK